MIGEILVLRGECKRHHQYLWNKYNKRLLFHGNMVGSYCSYIFAGKNDEDSLKKIEDRGIILIYWKLVFLK